MVTTKSLVIREWETPNIVNYREKGDFYTLSGLQVDVNTGYLRRCQAWSARVTLPATTTAYHGAFFDSVALQYCLVTTDTVSAVDSLNLITYNESFEFIGNTKLHATETALAGRSPYNVIQGNGYLYYIAGTNVYRTPTAAIYTTPPPTNTTLYDGTSDAPSLIFIVGSTPYICTATRILKVPYATAMLYYQHNTTIVHAAILRGYVILTSVHGDKVTLLRLSIGVAPTLVPLIDIHGLRRPTAPIIATLRDHLYIIPEIRLSPEPSSFDIYKFNGTSIEKIQSITSSTNSTIYSVELATLGDNTLIMSVNQGPTATGGLINKTFYQLRDTQTQFIPMASPPTAEHGKLSVFAKRAIAQHLVRPLPAATPIAYAFYYLGNLQTLTLTDGYAETSWLDMGDPAKQKRLLRIAVTLDNAITNFKIIVKYKADQASSWTTAPTASNTAHVLINDLGLNFYTLKVQIEIDDDSTGAKDYAITALSITYSIE